MSDRTTYFNLLRLQAGDPFGLNDYEFSDNQMVLLDRFLKLIFEHDHKGLIVGTDAPTDPPVLALDTSVGALPGGLTATYEISFVVDDIESIASPSASQITPDLLLAPDAPTLAAVLTGGTLKFGNYSYVLTAWHGDDGMETRAENPKLIQLRAQDGAAQKVVVTLPSLPDGADGFNLYQLVPNSANYHFISSFGADGDGDGTVTIDGTIHPDCERLTPQLNTTSQTNTITVTPPTVPMGATWRLYRTFDPTDWTNSFLGEFPQATAEYDDDGAMPTAGSPPGGLTSVTLPGRIDLADGMAVENGLAPANVSAFPQVVHFWTPGLVTVAPGKQIWFCPFTKAILRDINLSLGDDTIPPAGADLIVAIMLSRGGGTWTNITTVAPPTIAASAFDAGAFGFDGVIQLASGDRLRLDVIQKGSTSLETDIAAVVRLWAQEAADTTSIVFT